MLCTHSTTNHPPVHAHCCSYLPPCSRCNRGYVGCGPLQTSRESRVHYTWTFKICKNNLPFGRFLLVKRHKFYRLGRSRLFLRIQRLWENHNDFQTWIKRFFGGFHHYKNIRGDLCWGPVLVGLEKICDFSGKSLKFNISWYTMHFASFCIAWFPQMDNLMIQQKSSSFNRDFPNLFIYTSRTSASKGNDPLGLGATFLTGGNVIQMILVGEMNSLNNVLQNWYGWWWPYKITKSCQITLQDNRTFLFPALSPLPHSHIVIFGVNKKSHPPAN